MTRQPKVGAIVAMLALTGMVALGPSAGRADQVILDDLIVVGSACVGLDCTNDEPFAFTTLGLKENNLRLFFNDTSITAAFPDNDWEILVNDVHNGGESYMGFADRGQGVVEVSGQGFCEGGFSDGESCIGSFCAGICAGGDRNGEPCFSVVPETCSDSGGFCEGEGTCVQLGAIIFRIEAGGPEDSLVIDSLGNVHIAGDLTVAGTINGLAGLPELQQEVEALRNEIETIKSFPAIRNFLDHQ